MWDASSQRIWDRGDVPHTAVDVGVDRAGRCALARRRRGRAPAAVWIEGLCLNGWQFTNRVVLRPWSSPRDARGDLERRFGTAGRAEEVFGEPDGAASGSWRRRLRTRRTGSPSSSRRRSARSAGSAHLRSLVVHLAGHQLTDPAAVLARMDDASGATSTARWSAFTSPRTVPAGSSKRCHPAPTWSCSRCTPWPPTRHAPTCSRKCSRPY